MSRGASQLPDPAHELTIDQLAARVGMTVRNEQHAGEPVEASG